VYRLILILMILVLFVQCQKSNSVKKTNETNANESNTVKQKFDVEKMKNIINKSNRMDIEVFFAISFCHKYFVSQFEKEADMLSDYKKTEFFEKKKVEFYKTIKYSSKQYDDFLDKNTKAITDYISTHPDFAEFFTTHN